MNKLFQPIWNSQMPYLGRLEFLAATATLLLVVTILPDDVRYLIGNPPFWEVIFSIEFLRALLTVLVLYVGAVVMNFYAVPALLNKDSIRQGLLLTAAAFTALALVFWQVDVLIPALLFVAGYSVIRYAGIYLYRNSSTIHARYKLLSPAVVVALFIWALGTVPSMLTGEFEVVAFWITVIPASILFYSYALHALAPASAGRKYPVTNYMLRVFVLLIALVFIVSLASGLMTDSEEIMVMFGMLLFGFHFFFTAPVVWLQFKRSAAGKEVLSLKKELKQSVASFDFLRSQINPHFLFNALNTLYGMAIVEKASRTGEGIQRLGDMMRFMLHENIQERIPLAREVEYVKNYIAFQRLRTDTTPSIKLETFIDDEVFIGSIPPMLLIPFVENAFKHGISFRDPSHIRVSLNVEDEVLYFDIQNSKHLRTGNDPERDNNGIGLNNVKQRLELLFPNSHSLIIRETVHEYFVHLTLKLSLQKV